MSEPKFVPMGWQGLSGLVPADWSIGMIGGDAHEGNVRLDDGHMPRLMVKWSQSETPVSLTSKIDGYLSELQKRSKKQKQPMEIKRNVHLVSKRGKARGEVQGYSWHAECQSFGAAWQCPQCRRIVMAEVMGPLEEDTQRLAREVLSSLEDHPRDGWATWAAYGLSFAVPEAYELARSKFMSALLEFEFTHDTERLAVFRWGIAETILRDTALLQWARPHLNKRLKEFTFEVEETELRGHPALVARGEKTHLSDRLRRLGRRLASKYFADTCLCRVWHCADTNKVYYLECLLDQERLDQAEGMLARLPCHDVLDPPPAEPSRKGRRRT